MPATALNRVCRPTRSWREISLHPPDLSCFISTAARFLTRKRAAVHFMLKPERRTGRDNLLRNGLPQSPNYTKLL